MSEERNKERAMIEKENHATSFQQQNETICQTLKKKNCKLFKKKKNNKLFFLTAQFIN